jgi:hypothetical protein
MLRLVRSLLLLLVLGVGQANVAFAIACAAEGEGTRTGTRSGEHSHCLPASPQSYGNGAGAGEPGHFPHDGGSCAAMVSCQGVVALPAPALVPLHTGVARYADDVSLAPPHSRTNGPANPPPRS